MKKKVKFAIFLFISLNFTICLSQDAEVKNVLRVNFVNPSLEYEVAIGNTSVISAGIGAGYNGAFRNLTFFDESGVVYIIAPFFDTQYKFFYNRNERKRENKNLEFNSGNFFSFRGIIKGPSIFDNVTRIDNVDFAFGPTWGLQRAFNKMHLLVDFGPQYYFDTFGNNGFFPLMIQVNFGLNLSR